METHHRNICITSFNSTGLGIAVQNFLSTLSLFSNILCLQEHFLLDSKSKNYSNTDKLRKLYSSKYDMFIIPAEKEHTQISKGRGKGGLATLWDKNLTKYVSQVKCSSFRLQVTQFSFPSGSLLILNTYFPCDPRVNDFNDEELLALLAEIKNVMNNQACKYNLVLGDLNSHFSRQTRFTTIIQNFFDDINFLVFWENTDQTAGHVIHEVDYTHQHVHDGETFVSTLDHFVSNIVLFSSVVEAGVIHDGQNPSNHSPIFAKIAMDNIDIVTENIKTKRKVNWDKSTAEAKKLYLTTLARNLDKLAVPECVQCRDFHCITHMEELEDYTISVLESIEAAAQSSLACTGRSKQAGGQPQAVPGWSDYVKPYAEESRFWFATWQSAGKPRAGGLYDAMIYSKRQYKYAIRRLRRVNNKMQNDKFVQGILSGGVNIFQEIKKHQGKAKNISSRIDDQVGARNIANKFASIYENLYNQHENTAELEDVSNSIAREIKVESLVEADKITNEVVRKALKQMKGGKRDVQYDIQSDCLTNGPESLLSHLTNLIKSFVVHGSVPYVILICTLLPLVKDNLADTTSSDNYRAIATGSLLLKLLDIVLLLLTKDIYDL